ncbi:FtsW/RodA/SpoVE family cell cycle protein [Bacillus sp. SM2101]|uniref:FtsW/RodA/SpoVE family cell cycle protein n=1 Tax=Bacillus sp. SM2101 TaxID=2805366 RepID=UPI001BDE9AEE|nr:FtsW/RodA/SpoVE family cell cycle protein [Bacillus sp. SM2101]
MFIREYWSNAGWLGQINESGKEFVPFAHTDFAFLGVAYELGWIIAIILSFWISRMVVVYHKISDKFGRMLVMGDISIFTVQAVYNISMVLGFLSLTSIPLPFKLWFNAHCTKYNGCRYCTECVSKKDLIFVTATLK